MRVLACLLITTTHPPSFSLCPSAVMSFSNTATANERTDQSMTPPRSPRVRRPANWGAPPFGGSPPQPKSIMEKFPELDESCVVALRLSPSPCFSSSSSHRNCPAIESDSLCSTEDDLDESVMSCASCVSSCFILAKCSLLWLCVVSLTHDLVCACHQRVTRTRT